MHIQVTDGKKKDIRGRRIVGYWARFSDVQGDGATPQEALGDLESKLRSVARTHHTRVTCFAGHVIVVSYSCHSWQYNIVRPEDITSAKPKGVYSCSSGFDTQEAAQKAACRNLADNLLPDERAYLIADEPYYEQMKKNLEWQANYKERFAVAREYGMNENQADLYARCAPGVELPKERDLYT